MALLLKKNVRGEELTTSNKLISNIACKAITRALLPNESYNSDKLYMQKNICPARETRALDFKKYYKNCVFGYLNKKRIVLQILCNIFCNFCNQE